MKNFIIWLSHAIWLVESERQLVCKALHYQIMKTVAYLNVQNTETY